MAHYATKLSDLPRMAPSTSTLDLPVRRPPDAMPEVGYLTREGTDAVLALYGRHNGCFGRSGWEYAYSPTQGNACRISVCTSPHQPVSDGERVTLADGKVWVVHMHPARYLVHG